MKKPATLILAALMICMMTCPALAAELPGNTAPARSAELFPSEVVETLEGDHHRLEKIYLLTAADNPSNIPTEDFEREGYHYTLLDVTRQDYTESDVKEYSETFAVTSDSKDMDVIMPMLPAAREVTTEDGYTGILTLDTASIQVEAAGYGSSSRTVTATRSYPNLSDADSSLLPKSIEDSGRTLTLADVQWQESGGYYNATATYSGTATSKYATGYNVTANYAGEVIKTISGEMVYTAIFSGVPIQTGAGTNEPDSENSQEVQAPGTAEADKPTEPSAQSGIGLKWLLILPIGAGIAGAIFGGRILLKKYKAKKEWKEFTT